MSFGTLCLSLSLVWFAVHAINRLFLARRHNHSSLLPTATTTRNHNATHVTLKYLHLRIQTTAWNSAHEQLASQLASKQFRGVRKVLSLFYDLGSGAGVMGMFLGVGVLAWTLGELGASLFERFVVEEKGAVVKRALESIQPMQTARTTSILKPIIPGVTVPLTDLPIIFLSVCICQIIHESGHALSAALEQIPLLTTGLSLTLILPSAFVTFPRHTPTSSSTSIEASKHKSKQREKARSKMRVIAGGAWHNLVFCGVLIAPLRTRWMWGLVGYEDVSSLGRVVLGFDEDSPLRDHIPLNTLITALDDISLGDFSPSSGTGVDAGREDGDDDIWNAYLTRTYRPTEREKQNGTMGWCVDKQWWMAKSTTCCDRLPNSEHGGRSPSAPRLSCFTPLDKLSSPDAGQRCLDPMPLLTNPNGVEDGNEVPQTEEAQRRCSLSNPCPADEKCIVLREDEQILRITFEVGEDRTGAGKHKMWKDVLLWSGPRVEVWEQVEVGTLRPRFRFLPLVLPRTLQIFHEYLKMVTISLYLFNLLPLLFLDGTQLLDAILDFVFEASFDALDEIDLEALGDGMGGGDRGRRRGQRRGRRKYWVGKVIKYGTTGLLTGCVGLGVINWIVTG